MDCPFSRAPYQKEASTFNLARKKVAAARWFGERFFCSSKKLLSTHT